MHSTLNNANGENLLDYRVIRKKRWNWSLLQPKRKQAGRSTSTSVTFYFVYDDRNTVQFDFDVFLRICPFSKEFSRTLSDYVAVYVYDVLYPKMEDWFRHILR